MDRMADEIRTNDRHADDKILLNAIESADFSQTSRLLRSNHSFSQDVLDQALISACHHGLKYVVQTLVGLRANVEFKDTQGNTPLMISVGNGCIDIVRFLLLKKADVNVFNSAGDTALILSIRPSGSSEMVKVLLVQEGIDFNHQNRDGYTALMKAIEAMDIDTMELLLDKYTKTRMDTSSYWSILHTMYNKIEDSINSKGQTDQNLAYSSRLGNIYNFLEEYRTTKISPLVLAAKKCDATSVNILLNCKFISDIDGKRDINKSFKEIFDINQSSYSDIEIETIKQLLDCGADVNATWLSYSRQKSTVLFNNFVPVSGRNICAINIAAEIGQCELVELLIKYKAEINPINYSDSPLEHALSHGHTDCAKLLIQYGAELNFELALSSAVRLQVPEYMNFLYDNYKNDIINYLANKVESLSELLISAVQRGNLEIIGRVLDLGADVNQPDRYGLTPLVKSKNGEVTRLLITRGADVNQVIYNEDFSMTPLINIIKKSGETSSDLEIVKVLLENGACVNGINEDISPLILAASRRGNGAMLQLLLDHGADINHQDESGNTALMEAVCKGCPKNVLCLLQAVTDKKHLNIQNHDGLSALMCAVNPRTSELEIVKALLENGACVNGQSEVSSPLLLAASKPGNGAVLQLLLDHGADSNQQDKSGNTALITALRNHYVQNVSVLMQSVRDKKHNLNVQSRDGLSALMWAVIHENDELVKDFIHQGADVNIKDVDGNNALLLALSNTWTDSDIAANLISAGSDVNCQNNKGFSPLMLAAQNTLADIIILLLDSGADVNAVSKLNKTKTALSFVSSGHFGGDIITCIHSLLNRGANSSNVNPTVLHTVILQGDTDFIRQLIQCGLGPADVSTVNTWWPVNIGNTPTVSPLFVALFAGKIHIARYFVGNLFLTNSDVTSLMLKKSSLQIPELRRFEKCVEFLDEISSQPLSLFKLAFVTVSSAVGTSPGRETRVGMLPLPQTIKDKLLFKSEVVTFKDYITEFKFGIGFIV